MRLDGATQGAVVAVFDYSTGELVSLESHDGEWVSPGLAPGTHSLLIASPGAVLSVIPLHGNRLLMGRLRPGDVPTVTVGPARVLRGVVKDNGRPVAGADIIADP